MAADHPPAGIRRAPIPKALTPAERRLRWALRIGGAVFALETLAYLVPALLGPTDEDWVQLPFVASSFVKAGFLAGLCAIAASDIRRYSRVVSLLVAGFVLWVVAGFAILLFGDTSERSEILGVELEMTTIVWAGIGLEAALALLFGWLHRAAVRSRYSLRYLSVGQFRTLEALSETLIPDKRPDIAPEQIAANVDTYLQSFDAKRKWIVKAALIGLNFYSLLYGRLPLVLMATDSRREFLQRRFGDDVARRRIGSFRRWLVQGMIRLGHQFVFVGYYGDAETWPVVGYAPYSERPGVSRPEPSPRGRLAVEDARRLRDDELEAAVVIVGSGAAGALLGYRLAEAGKRVLVLERGRHVEPADFTEDEAQMLATLYRDGAVQMARDFKLQVLQGMCVGGTTVINNAVSLPPPPEVLAEWERRAGDRFDGAAVLDAAERVRDLLKIEPQPQKILQPGARKFVDGVEKLQLDRTGKLTTVAANIEHCLGCGYCNIGCAYGRKLSALETLLPWAQERFDTPLRIVSDCAAEGIEVSDGRVEAIHCRANGKRIRVRATERYVLAAGAVNSPYLLGRSGVGGPRVGRGASFNVGSPITAEFDERLDSHAGLQITHVLEPGPGGPEVVMETWWNPVLSQSLAMPGWFEDHRRNMLRYAHMTATGVLIGSEPTARVTKALFGGPDIVYEPSRADLERVIAGLKLAGRIYLAAGAKRVMPATFQFRSYREPEQLDELDELVRSNEDIQLGTGHPQGGNALGATVEDGPVDPATFRVHGTRNLHLCDASVFPTSVRVNPQLTVMALAELAAAGIAEELA